MLKRIWGTMLYMLELMIMIFMLVVAMYGFLTLFVYMVTI